MWSLEELVTDNKYIIAECEVLMPMCSAEIQMSVSSFSHGCPQQIPNAFCFPTVFLVYVENTVVYVRVHFLFIYINCGC